MNNSVITPREINRNTKVILEGTFKTEEFKKFSKSNDYVLEVLSYLQEGSAKLSIARTIMGQSPLFLSDQKAFLKLKDLHNQLDDLQYYIRSLENKDRS